MVTPQVMPGGKPLDPWDEKPPMDLTDPWRAGGDPNASQGNEPAIAIPGAGNPPPPGAMGGMSKDGMLSMPGQMGGGGGMMKPSAQLGGVQPGGNNPMAAMAGAAAGGLAGAGQPGGMGGMKPPMGGPMMKPQPMPGAAMGGSMGGGMAQPGGGMLRQLLLRKMQGGQ